MSYTTYYISSSGQPANNDKTHDTIEDAIDAWKANMGALLLRSGGKSVLIDNDDEARLEWFEGCEGGFVTAMGGAWEADLHYAALIASEDGESLTAEQAADLIRRD